MKVSTAIELNQYVVQNEERFLSADRGTLDEIAAGAAAYLSNKACKEVKCNAGNIADAFKANGIPTRRPSRVDSKTAVMQECIERQNDEIALMRRLLTEVLAKDFIPDTFRDRIFADLPERIRDAVLVSS